MADVKDLLRHVRVATDAAELAKDVTAESADVTRCCEVLQLLKEAEVTAQVLQETRAGKTIRKLVNHDNKSISDAATSVVDTWKAVIKKQAALASEPAKPAKSPAPTAAKAAAVDPTAAAARPGSASTSAAAAPRQSMADVDDLQRQDSVRDPNAKPRPPFKQPPAIGDKARENIRKGFAQALLQAVHDDYEDVDSPYMLAAAAEEAIFQKFDCQMDTNYKSKVRTLLFNLRDKANPDLRRRVVLGEIPAADLADMSSDDLASDTKRQENDKIRAHMKKETERSNQATGNITDMFRCGKCKKRRCTYYQMQTRSADEPMTTFVRCLECTHRWKFC